MKADLASCRYGNHASNLGALIADALAREAGVRAYIVDPVVVDELSPLARRSGLPDLPRRSIFHALNQKATARKAAAALGRRYEECTLIVAHLGRRHLGRAARGRAGSWTSTMPWTARGRSRSSGPARCPRATGCATSSRGSTRASTCRRCSRAAAASSRGSARTTSRRSRRPPRGAPGGAGGRRRRMPARLAGLDGRLCDELISALCYASAKAIAGLAAAVSGKVDAVVLTGGLARSERVVGEIRDRVAFLAPVLVYPGENELEALVHGVLAGAARRGRAPGVRGVSAVSPATEAVLAPFNRKYLGSKRLLRGTDRRPDRGSRGGARRASSTGSAAPAPYRLEMLARGAGTGHRRRHPSLELRHPPRRVRRPRRSRRASPPRWGCSGG